MKSIATWQIPIKTASESNSSEHWSTKYKRHRLQKWQVKKAFLERPPMELAIPCTIFVTRIAPRMLDCHDNLPVSLKWIVDEIAAQVTGDHRAGRADDRLSWVYRQEKGKPREYAVRIEICL